MSELIDNRAHRIRTLKEIIHELHRGADPESVRGTLKSIVRETSSSEIAAMEQELIAGGMPVEEMISKERRILLPMSRDTLTDDEWAEIWQESPRYGFCLVEPREGYRPPAVKLPDRVAELPRDQAVVFPTGALTFEQLRGILGALPVDVTFVDADDRVRYFAVRDGDGSYLGTLEVTQDLTWLRELEGERRLLHWAGGSE
jgi:hypothetical protein